MKKICRALLLAVMALGVFSAVNTQSASASSYHKGTPTALRGYWRTKMHKYRGGLHSSYYWGYSHLTIKKNSFRDAGIQAGAEVPTKLSYRYLGHHTYYLKGSERMGKSMVSPFKWKIKKINSKKLTTQDVINKGSKTTTWYRFSGQISKHTYYPYPYVKQAYPKD